MNKFVIYTKMQGARNIYSLRGTAKIVAASLCFLARLAAGDTPAKTDPTPAAATQTAQAPVKEWEPDQKEPKIMEITHKDGRALKVFLLRRTETDITCRRVRDCQWYTIPIADLADKDQETIRTYWNIQTRFPNIAISVTCQGTVMWHHKDGKAQYFWGVDGRPLRCLGADGKPLPQFRTR